MPIKLRGLESAHVEVVGDLPWNKPSPRKGAGITICQSHGIKTSYISTWSDK